jgi:N,N-dimethylformamidase
VIRIPPSDPRSAQLPALYLEGLLDPGAVVAVHCSGTGRGTLSVVRVSGLSGAPLPTGYLETPVTGETQIELQPRGVPMGSSARTDSGPRAGGGAAWRWTLRLFPTLTDCGEALSWGDGTIRIGLEDGRLVAHFPGGRVGVSIDARCWYEVVLEREARGRLLLRALPIGPGAWCARGGTAEGVAAATPIDGALRFGSGFNGKVESPALLVDGTLQAAWNFADSMTLQRVPGHGPQATPLELVNAPKRGVTGSLWNGSAHDWRSAPEHYAAIHFHEDDLADCGWPEDAGILLPPDLRAGFHAVRLECDSGVRYAPFFVRPPRRTRLAFLASTFSYLAYGNSLFASSTGAVPAARFPAEVAQMRRFGLSTYSRHRDGSEIGLVSQRRPILNATPGFLGEAIGGQVLWNDDLRIIEWLDRSGEPYEVITDHDLHERGREALRGYEVLVTGSHPEYHSDASLDACEAFVERGGRLLYLGGNGFYWRVTTLPDAPHVMELRRAEGGIRLSAEPPGEYRHQSDGRLGGLWRRNGRPPNRLVGVGFSAQGNADSCRAYERTPAADDPRARFLFDGVAAGPIGSTAPVGGAAGYELDRADFALGTPPHALVVARSQPFDGEMHPVNEERLSHVLVDAVDPLRADMTFFEGPAGGAVLGVGSIAFAGSLAESEGAGRIASNALRRFLDPAPFTGPARREE